MNFCGFLFTPAKTINCNILHITVCVSFYKLSTRHSKQKTYDDFYAEDVKTMMIFAMDIEKPSNCEGWIICENMND